MDFYILRVEKKNIPLCLERLGEIDKKRKMPVLITTEAIYKIICPNKPISAYQFYSLDESIPIFPSN